MQVHLLAHRSGKLTCRCSSSSADIVVHPTTKRPLRWSPQQRRVLTGPVEQTSAAELTSIASPAESSSHPLQQASAARRAPALPSGYSVGPGYGVVPEREDLPPAVNAALPCSTKQQLPNSPARQARRTFKRTVSSNNDRFQTQQAETLVPKQRQQTGHRQSPQDQPGNTRQLWQRTRSRQHDPGRAFMQAGMPGGLWVLPLDAKSEAPPAPPPVAPEDPAELLQVLQRMAPPGRKLVMFKGGGYIYNDMEQLIQDSGLSHVLRLTNLVRKANCVLAKPVWDNGRRINLKQHQAAAEKHHMPFLIITQLDPVHLVAAVRPLMIKSKIVLQQRQQQHEQVDLPPIQP